MLKFLFTQNVAAELISKLSYNIEDFTYITSQLLRSNLPCALIFMQNNKIIQKYDKILESYRSSQSIPSNFLILYCVIRKFMPALLNFYFKGKIVQNVSLELINSLSEQINQETYNFCQPLDILVRKYYQLLAIRNQFQKIPKLRELVSTILKTNDKKNLNMQYSLNYIKKNIQDLQKDMNINLCCRYYYELDKTIEAPENDVQQFKKYNYPIQNDNLILHIRKTVVGFLNRRGGSVLIGLQEQKTKCVFVRGMYLTPEQKNQFQKFIIEKIIESIFPKFEYQKSNYQIAYKNRLALIQNSNNRCEIFFNKYISMDYLPIVDEKTLLNIQNCYLVRLRVRPGDPKQFYHLIGQTFPVTPIFYVRQDKMVKKKTFLQALSELQTRVNSKITPQYYKPYHQECKFILSPYEFTQQYAQIQKQYIKSYRAIEKKKHKQSSQLKQNQNIDDLIF